MKEVENSVTLIGDDTLRPVDGWEDVLMNRTKPAYRMHRLFGIQKKDFN